MSADLDPGLEALQVALLETLAEAGEGADPEAVRARLIEHPACVAHRAWIASWDARMLAVAIELVGRWGLRGPWPGAAAEPDQPRY